MKDKRVSVSYTHLQGFQWTARCLKDWRQVLIDIAEANPNEADAKAAVEAEIERYARVFWTLNSTDMGVVVSEMKEKNSKSSVTIPTPTEAEMKTLVNGYKAQLYERLYPVTQSVSVYMQRKAEAAYLAALNEVKEFFNQSITFNIVEDVPDGEKSQYDGYALRFAPLSENAVKESWSGAMKGTGGASTKFTLLGYVPVSYTHLDVYKRQGEGHINEASITGEAVPVSKKKGSGVYAGTILENGTIQITADRVGEDTTFGKIIELVEEAQDSKSEAERFIDRFSKYYLSLIHIFKNKIRD